MKRSFILLFSLILTVCCETESYKTYSNKYRVFFSCNIMDAPYNQAVSRGHFVSIRKNNGKLLFDDSDGHKSDAELTAVQSASFMMGLAGLIIGTPIFDNDNTSIWAYDLGCPECDEPDKSLTFDIKNTQPGIATCLSCQGQWNLNSSGIPVNTDGKKRRPLYRYPASLNNGILTVSN